RSGGRNNGHASRRRGQGAHQPDDTPRRPPSPLRGEGRVRGNSSDEGDYASTRTVWARATNCWRFRQSFLSTLNRRDEISAKAFCLAFIELGGRNELILSIGMKLTASHQSAERAFLITLSAGMPATFPDRSARRRRSASCSHSLSTAASPTGSRLEMR